MTKTFRPLLSYKGTHLSRNRSLIRHKSSDSFPDYNIYIIWNSNLFMLAKELHFSAGIIIISPIATKIIRCTVLGTEEVN